MIGLWVFTLFWNAIAIPLILNVRPNISENPLALIVYLVPLAGVILLFPAVFIAIDLLIIVASVDYLSGGSTVEIDGNGMRLREQWLGISAKEKSYEPATIASIDGMTAAAHSKSFGVTLKLTAATPSSSGPTCLIVKAPVQSPRK